MTTNSVRQIISSILRRRGHLCLPVFLALWPYALPATSNAEVLTVKEFKALAPQKGEFEISGFVAKHYRCPPCPPEAMCKPCMPENVLVSGTQEILEQYPASGNYLVIFTDKSDALSLGKRYDFTVQVLTSKTSGYGEHDLRLRRYVER